MMAETVWADPDFAEIHDELRAVARDLLAKHGPGERVEARVLAAQGWSELEVPAEFDGAGATFAETAIVLEELGRAAAGSGYLGSVLGIGACALLAATPGRERLLRAVATGEATATAAVAGSAGDVAGSTPPFRIQDAGNGPALSGRAEFVPDAVTADRLLLLAADPDAVPVIVAVAADAAGLGRTAQPVVDETRSFGLVIADNVVVPEDSVWRFDGDPAVAIRRLHDRAAVAIACDSLGLSAAMLDATVDYACTRAQFGRPIGSFQAVKHACADMLVQTTVARQLLTAAVRQLAAADPGATVAAAMAKSYTCTAAVEIAGKAMQLHGGFGYTWESGIHRYLKRATLNRALFGTPAAHRRQLAARYR
jgi:alkylation response protein AidB-like acyl-CoA dehydrogenase